MIENKFRWLRRWDSESHRRREEALARPIDQLLGGEMGSTLIRFNYSISVSELGAPVNFHCLQASRKFLKLIGWGAQFYSFHPMDFSRGFNTSIFTLNTRRREEEDERFRKIIHTVWGGKPRSSVPIDLEPSEQTTENFPLIYNTSRILYFDILQALQEPPVPPAPVSPTQPAPPSPKKFAQARKTAKSTLSDSTTILWAMSSQYNKRHTYFRQALGSFVETKKKLEPRLTVQPTRLVLNPRLSTGPVLSHLPCKSAQSPTHGKVVLRFTSPSRRSPPSNKLFRGIDIKPLPRAPVPSRPLAPRSLVLSKPKPMR